MTDRVSRPDFEESCDLAVRALEEIMYRALLGGDIELEIEVVIEVIEWSLETVTARPSEDAEAHDRIRLLVQRLAEVLRGAVDRGGIHGRS